MVQTVRITAISYLSTASRLESRVLAPAYAWGCKESDLLGNLCPSYVRFYYCIARSLNVVHTSLMFDVA